MAKLDIDWSAIRIATDADAIAVWRRIFPVAREWELRVAQIPDALVAPLAGALIRKGNIACAPLDGGSCTPGYLGFPDPPPDATFDDPCLRRALVLWALSALDGAQIAALVPALTALIADPRIDDEVVESILAAAKDEVEAVRMTLVAAAARGGHARAVGEELYGLSQAALATAATTLHVDAAVEALDVSLSRPVFLAAVRDPKLLPATRVQAMEDLSAEVDRALPRDLEQALADATRDRDCQVAAAAMTVLARHGRRDALPRRPRTRRVADALRAWCLMAATDAVRAAATFVGPGGLKVIESSYDANLELAPDDDDADGDHDPRTSRTVQVTRRRELVAIPFDTDLVKAYARCRATTCPVSPGIEIALQFVPARDGGLYLDAIERRARGDCGSNP